MRDTFYSSMRSQRQRQPFSQVDSPHASQKGRVPHAAHRDAKQSQQEGRSSPPQSSHSDVKHFPQWGIKPQSSHSDLKHVSQEGMKPQSSHSDLKHVPQ
jgi:hypothetical protein